MKNKIFCPEFCPLKYTDCGYKCEKEEENQKNKEDNFLE